MKDGLSPPRRWFKAFFLRPGWSPYTPGAPPDGRQEMNKETRRDFLKKGALGLAAGALGPGLAACGGSKKPEKGETLRLLHVTDTHLDLGIPETVKWMEMLAEKIDRDFKDVDFVLFGGDNFNNNVPGLKDAERFKKILSALQVPWYSVRGNKESSPKPKGDPLDRKDYARMFFSSDLEVSGRDWKLVKGNFAVLGVDSTLEQHGNGLFSPESLAFVEKELKENPKRRHILLDHHPYSNFWGGTDKKDIHKYVLGNAGEVRKRLFKYPNLVLTLSGHKHLDHVSREGHLTVIATLGFIVPQDRANSDDHRFRLVEIEGDTIRQKLVSIV